MADSTTLLIILGIIFFIATTYFSLAETALVSINKLQVAAMLESGKRKKAAKRVDTLFNSKENLISTVLIMTNVTAIAFSTISAAVGMRFFGEGHEGIGLIVSAAFSSLLIITLGDIVPKVLAAKFPQQVSLFVSGLMLLLVRVLLPITAIINKSINKSLEAMGMEIDNKAAMTEDDIEATLHIGLDEGIIHESQAEMMKRLLAFKATYAWEVMTPRADIKAIPHSMAHGDVMQLFKDEQYTRLPIYKDDMDSIVGILHFKDFVFNDGEDWQGYMRGAFYAYEMQPIDNLLTKMKADNVNIAIVTDEYGGTAGIISMQDIIESIVGRIFDEYDDVDKELEPIDDNGKAYMALGYMRLDDLNRELGTNLLSEDYDTLSGYVMGLFGDIPKEGQLVTGEGIDFVVDKMDKFRIERIKIVINQNE